MVDQPFGSRRNEDQSGDLSGGVRLLLVDALLLLLLLVDEDGAIVADLAKKSVIVVSFFFGPMVQNFGQFQRDCDAIFSDSIQ